MIAAAMAAAATGAMTFTYPCRRRPKNRANSHTAMKTTAATKGLRVPLRPTRANPSTTAAILHQRFLMFVNESWTIMELTTAKTEGLNNRPENLCLAYVSFRTRSEIRGMTTKKPMTSACTNRSVRMRPRSRRVVKTTKSRHISQR